MPHYHLASQMRRSMIQQIAKQKQRTGAQADHSVRIEMKSIQINEHGSNIPDGDGPCNPKRMQAPEKIEANSQIRRFLDTTRRDLFQSFLRGTSEYELTRRMGGRSHRVCRIDVESALRETAREERTARIAAERKLRRLAA
jgi:hypothetical protein